MTPTIGATIYTQRWDKFPAIKAGPIERAGFIEAPHIGPATNASSKTVVPTAIAVNVVE